MNQAATFKLKAMIALLTEHGRVMVRVHAEACVLPEGLTGETLLDVWPMAPVKIPDLDIDDDGFRGTFQFPAGPYFVSVPWSAVITVGSEVAGLYLYDAKASAVPPEPAPEATTPPRPALRVVK